MGVIMSLETLNLEANLYLLLFGSLPKMKPKSMWKNMPSLVIIRFSRCLSPIPSKYVAVQ